MKHRILLAALLASLAVPALSQTMPGGGGGGGAGPGGTSGQVQYNNGGSLGGFTLGGDATLVSSTGVLTLGTVNSNIGTFSGITVNAKGLVTAATGPSGSAILSGNGSGGFTNVTIGSNLSFAGGTLNATGAVSSISNVDGSLTCSPTSGAAVCSINTAHANTFSAAQTFGAGDLVAPNIVNTGTLTLPTTTDTLVGRATSDTLTNKTLTSPTVNGGSVAGTISGTATYSGNLTFSGSNALGTISSGNLGNGTGYLSTNLSGIVPSANGGAGSITGLVKATSGVTAVAVIGTDYAAPGAVDLVTSNQTSGTMGTRFSTQNVEDVTGAAVTLTYPAASTLLPNGANVLYAIGGNVTITPDASDAICTPTCGSTGANATLTSGYSGVVTADTGNHKLYLAIYVNSASGGGFPITIGSTSVAASSTTTSISGLTLAGPTFSGTIAGTPTASGNWTVTGSWALGTPSALVLSNATGLPISGITGLGTGVGTALAANVTGSGGIVLAASPTLSGTVGGNLTFSGNLTTSGTVTAGNIWDLVANALVDEIANAASTGTTVHKLAKLTGAPSTAVILLTSDTVFQGIVAGGAGTTGSAQIARSGQATCVFDAATTAGDWVVPSVTSGGECHDTGSTTLPSAQVVGRILSTNGAGGTFNVEISPANPGASTGGGGVSITAADTSLTVTPSPITGTGTISLNTGNINTWSAEQLFSGAAAASTPSVLFSGTIFTGGNGTTTVPDYYINDGASSPSSWSTSGTYLGINSKSGFVGNYIDFHLNGGASAFLVASTGATHVSSLTSTGAVAATGGTMSFNASSNNPTNINTGTSTGLVTIGNSTNTAKTVIANLGSDTGQTDSTVCATSAGTLYFGSGTLGICAGTSSIRFKHDVADLQPGLNEVMQLKPVSYYLNADHGDPTKEHYGFIAEDMVKVLPKLVGVDKEGKPNSADYLGIVAVLVKSVQQQQEEITSLKAELTKADARLDALSSNKSIEINGRDPSATIGNPKAIHPIVFH